MSKRDPLKDPKPGDVTMLNKDGRTVVFRVNKRDGRMVYYSMIEDGQTEEHDTFVEDWVDGSTEDEVIHAAD